MINDKHKKILTKSYLVYFLIVTLSLVIVGKVVKIQFFEGDKWLDEAKKITLSYKSIEAIRGNIYSADNSLLATSIPLYEIRFDPNVETLSDKEFYLHIDSLAYGLSMLFRDKSQEAYRFEMITARKNGTRYHLIKKNANYLQLKQLKKFPIFRRGKYKGGLISLQENKRIKPFRFLASRTIGYDKKSSKPVGLEGAYSSYLSGVDGKLLMRRISGGVWMDVSGENEVRPKNGYDVYTTIDLNFQDVAHQVLKTQLKKNNADHGCVILMDVKTGDVKAIVNLQRTSKGEYAELYNYAVGESTEPGSVFKLASLLAALEDGYVSLDDQIDTEDGTHRFYDRVMRDSKKGGYGVISLKKAFSVSSNVAVSKIINLNYADKPEKFIKRIKQMGFSEKLGIEISGEGQPYIKDPKNKNWSGVTLPWMSIGYESRLTPLHILTFYNAVANNGVMVKPRFVTKIMEGPKLIKEIESKVLKKRICSKSTIAKAHEMLKEVIDSGTAQNLKQTVYKIAGKTGTAQIANKKYGYKYKSRVSYQASFVGYFPAENPKYSCIVIVNAPSNNVYYGNLVAGPVFREVADKVYASSFDFQKNPERIAHKAFSRIPYAKNGYNKDFLESYKTLSIPILNKSNNSAWIVTKTDTQLVNILPLKIYSNLVPNVKGMGARDAVYLLESSGLKVIISGRGKVNRQSIRPGTRIKDNRRTIVLELV